MTNRFVNPIIKYTTSTLKTMPGAELYFYVTGTTTPKVTYQDFNGTIPHAQPVVALGDGHFPPIFLNGSYRAELKYLGVTQPGWPVDDIGATDAPAPLSDYNSGYSYSEGDLITGPDGKRYQSLQDNNLNNDPTVIGSLFWSEVFLGGNVDSWSQLDTAARSGAGSKADAESAIRYALDLPSPSTPSYPRGNTDGTYTNRDYAGVKADLNISTVTDTSLAEKATGPTFSTNLGVALFDGVTGKLLKSGNTLDSYFNDFSESIYVAFPSTVANYAALAGILAVAGQIVNIRCHTSGNIGGGQFLAVAGSVTNDGGTQINSAAAGIFWKRINYNLLDATFFGVIADNLTDDYQAWLRIKNYFGASQGAILFASGSTVCGTSLTIPSNVQVIMERGAQVKSGSLLLFNCVMAASANSTQVLPSEPQLGTDADNLSFNYKILSGNSASGGSVVAYNQDLVQSTQNVQSSAKGAYARYSEVRHGGATSDGGFVGLGGFSYLTSNGNPSGTVFDSVGVAGYGASLGFNYGGSSGLEKGAVFGCNFFARLDSGATFFSNVTGGEFNTEVNTGASVAYKTGLQIVGTANDKVQGYLYDCGIAISNIVGAVGKKHGILIGAMNGAEPIATTGTLIGTATSSTVATGIDFSSYTFNTAVIKSNAVTLLDGALVLGNSSTATRFIDFKSAGNPTNYNARLLCQSGTGTDGSGDVSLLASVLRLPATVPTSDGVFNLGSSALRWNTVYATTGAINTSDEREKTDIEIISDVVLDAWESVNFYQFKFKSAKDKKGDDARIHFGLVAQQVKSAFESAGIDPFKYGILCYDEWDDEWEYWDDEYEIVAEEKILKRPAGKSLRVAAGNRYGVRYDEALILEAACMRRKLEQLDQRLK